MKYLVTLIFTAAILFYACTKDVGMLPQAAPLTDSALVVLVKSADKYTWKSTTSTPDSVFTSDAAHAGVPYKMLMNLKAKNACTDNGKLPHNATFPDSSLLVKQLWNAGQTQVNAYAVLYKVSGAWKWAEYNANGTVIHSINANPNSCTGCHTNDRDKVWTFDAH